MILGRTLARRQFLRFAAAMVATPPLFMRKARAQSYPARPVRMIVSTGPGGQGDTSVRLIAQRLSEALGQSFYVENIPGAGGNIAHGTAARSAADGHTILAVGGSFFANPSLYAKVPYDPHKDFAPVTLVCSSPHVLAVHPSVPAHGIGQLVALARAHPGKLSYASAGRGTPAHLAGEMVKLALAVDVTHVPYHGGGPGITATVGGHVPVALAALPTALAHIRSGHLRALAMMSAKRSSLLPDVPTMAEATGHDLSADIVTGLLVPSGTPSEIIDLLYREIARIVATPETRERLLALGFEPIANSPDEFAHWIGAEVPKWGKVIREANIEVQ